MNEVIAAVSRVTQVMDEISNATQEQSDGIGQVNLAVIQIDDITQRNAALVEEAAAAAGNLALQTRCVSQAIAVFKLNSGHTARTSVAMATQTAADEHRAQKTLGENKKVKLLV
eukprot:gene23612-biopygen21066